MKQLVKTAKQQFEQRLQELHVIKRWEMCPTEVYYHCITGSHDFVLLREQDGEYKELHYGQPYETVVLGERFLYAMTSRLSAGWQPVKPLFDWYASADHEDEPFNLLDIFMCELEAEHHTFEDLYEEVPEPKTVTAREQWEKASSNAILIQQIGDDLYKVEVTDASIVFYTFRQGSYRRETFPPFSQLRKDNLFTINYISFVHSSHPDDMDAALDWLSGRKYTMGDITLLDIYDVYASKSTLDYEDRTFIEVAKQDFGDEIESLRNKLAEHIVQLCEQGMVVNYEALADYQTIGWEDGTFESLDYIEDFYFLKDSDTGQWKYYLSHGSDTWSGKLTALTVETLHNVISSMK